MNTTGKVWYTAVIALVILAVTATLVCVLGAPAAALDTDRHGRYTAYAKNIKTLNPDGVTWCSNYQPVRKDRYTGKIRYAARWDSGKPITLDKTNCVEDWDQYNGNPVGFRVIDLSPTGRYLKFYRYPQQPVGGTYSDAPVTIYRKDFKTGRLIKLGVVMESSFYTGIYAPAALPLPHCPPPGFITSTPCTS